MRLIFEVAVVLFLLSMVGKAYDDGFAEGLDVCRVAVNNDRT